MSWVRPEETDTYSASVEERAIDFCSFEVQDIRESPRNKQVPDLDFRSSRSPAQSASQKRKRLIFSGPPILSLSS
jgi:hypothetical protein